MSDLQNHLPLPVPPSGVLEEPGTRQGHVLPLPPAPAEPIVVKQPRRHLLPRLHRVATRLAFLLLALVLLLTAGSLSLRWVNPPTTMFMHEDEYVVTYMFVPLSDVSPNLVAAAIAHEDPAQDLRTVQVTDHGRLVGTYKRPPTQGFLGRTGGTDWERLAVRIKWTRAYGRDVGGSTTIEQQTVKNLFLTADRAPWRKAFVEPVVADVYGFVVPKRRQIELYLNIAEFGPGIFGACAASWYYFNKSPSRLTEAEAVDLVAVLPMPKLFRADIHGGVLPLRAPAGSTYSPRLLLEYARLAVPAQIRTDRTLQRLAAAGLMPGAPTGSCSRMPAGVARTLNQGPVLRHRS